MNPNAAFLKKLVEIHAVKFGSFTLKSGKQSPFYVDLRNTVSYPDMLNELAAFFKHHLSTNVQRICGVPYAALPMATALSLLSGLPMLIKRKEVKNYGTKKVLEGEYQKGDKVVVIEDVITSGESLVETIKELENEGLVVEQILVVLDREQGGMKRLSDKGYNISSLFSISSLLQVLHAEKVVDDEIVNKVAAFLAENNSVTIEKTAQSKHLPKIHSNAIAQKLLNIAHDKKSNLIASVDLTQSHAILDLLRKIGHGICAVKLHIDIIEDFSTDFITQLSSIAAQQRFLIIEDRKFADIGNTQLLQLSKGIFNISSWADMVTIHLISGEAALKAIQQWDNPNKPALIPIVEMSSEGALTDKAYAEKCQSFMYNYAEVIGAVCQTTKTPSGALKFTPGVNLSTAGDGKGQQYNTPSYAIENLGSDFLIIGRGLYLAEEPEKELDKYLSEVRKSNLFS